MGNCILKHLFQTQVSKWPHMEKDKVTVKCKNEKTVPFLVLCLVSKHRTVGA